MSVPCDVSKGKTFRELSGSDVGTPTVSRRVAQFFPDLPQHHLPDPKAGLNKSQNLRAGLLTRSLVFVSIQGAQNGFHFFEPQPDQSRQNEHLAKGKDLRLQCQLCLLSEGFPSPPSPPKKKEEIQTICGFGFHFLTAQGRFEPRGGWFPPTGVLGVPPRGTRGMGWSRCLLQWAGAGSRTLPLLPAFCCLKSVGFPGSSRSINLSTNQRLDQPRT